MPMTLATTPPAAAGGDVALTALTPDSCIDSGAPDLCVRACVSVCVRERGSL